jgi:hypothetical protein
MREANIGLPPILGMLDTGVPEHVPERLRVMGAPIEKAIEAAAK